MWKKSSVRGPVAASRANSFRGAENGDGSGERGDELASSDRLHIVWESSGRERRLQASLSRSNSRAGRYTIAVRVIDIFSNDTDPGHGGVDTVC